MAGVIDADTHIAESEGMWELMDKEMYPRRPVIVSVPDNTLYGTHNAFWLIDGNIVPKPAGKGSYRLITPSATIRQSLRKDPPIPCREITDVSARLAQMDKLSVEAQVVYPTLFLIYITDDVALEVALCRAYNRWMGQVWSKSNHRLKWVVVPPLRSIEETVKEMRWSKDNGAVGVFFRGVERDLALDDPYFFPVYEEARKLDMPVCVHTGAAAGSARAVQRVSAEALVRVAEVVGAYAVVVAVLMVLAAVVTASAGAAESTGAPAAGVSARRRTRRIVDVVACDDVDGSTSNAAARRINAADAFDAGIA